MTQILLLMHGVSGSIPREGLAQSDQPSVAALWSGGAGIAANDLCLWRLRLSKRVYVPEAGTKLRNERDIGNGPPQLT